jgi:hypothetical protein
MDGVLAGKHRPAGGLPKRPSAAFPSSFAVQRTIKYASRLRISGALHPGIFEQPAKKTSYMLPGGVNRRGNRIDV